MKPLLICLAGLLPATLMARYRIEVQIDSLPAAPASAAIYIAGNFNNWNPADEHTSLHKNEQGRWNFSVDGVDGGNYEFKFTRGDWNKVETDAAGKSIANRVLQLRSDTTLHFTIAGWADGFAGAARKISTASRQVTVMDTAFFIPQLERHRRIWIYLPKDYNSSGRRYPVLYMHDGQNLFDDVTSFAGEWGVDEALDSLANPGIVVGIDNGGAKRINEYNTDDMAQFGKGEGKAYLNFLVQTLKPYIDAHYRTLPGKNSTSIAGSSMGGLISFYTGLYHPEVFGKIGVFSPSFWLNAAVLQEIKASATRAGNGSQRYYFYAGGSESESMVPDMEAAIKEMKTLTGATTWSVVNPSGKHNEAYWRKAFPGFYKVISDR